VVKIAVPDNLRTGITKPNYYEPGVNLAYQELAEYYQFAVLPARVRRPRDKGAAENGFKTWNGGSLRRCENRQFFSMYDVNLAVKEKLNN